MKSIKNRILVNTMPAIVFFAVVICPGAGYSENESSYKKVDIDINGEDKEVGLRRLELLDKLLSQDMMDRKRSMVRDIEADYSRKTKTILDSLISPVFDNRVLTHLDVNFFAPEFESEVRANRKVSISIILKRDGFDTWVQQNDSRQEAMKSIKQTISSTFNIPVKNVSVLIVN